MGKFYVCDVNALNDKVVFNKYFKNASKYRKDKVNTLKFPKDKNLCLGAGVLTDVALAQYGKKESEMKYVLSKDGKPYFDKYNKLFNLAHSENIVVFAISDNEVGVDVEKIDDINLAIAKRFFTPKENEYIMSFEDEEKKKDAFFRMWTIKESFVKTLGKGLSIALNSFSVDLKGKKPVIKYEGDNSKYYVHEYDVFGFKAVVCCKDSDEDFELVTVELSK